MHDLMKLHENSTIVTKNIKLLDAACGEKDPLTLTRGKTHEHLMMTIDFFIKNRCFYDTA